MPTDWIVAAHLVATFLMTGIIWFVQIVHYPMLARLPHEDFAEIEREHCDRTGFVVAPPMLVEAFTLVWLILRGFDSPLFLFTAALLGVVWISTFILQVPAHRALLLGWNETAHRRLVLTNWIRTAGWTLRAGILVVIFL
ncbi:MAG: hypothetical protein ACO3FQ_04865 [Terrimicrobiaceae bacterium]